MDSKKKMKKTYSAYLYCAAQRLQTREREMQGEQAGRIKSKSKSTNTNVSRLKMANRRREKSLLFIFGNGCDTTRQGRVCCLGRYQDKHVDLALYTSMRARSRARARGRTYMSATHIYLFYDFDVYFPFVFHF